MRYAEESFKNLERRNVGHIFNYRQIVGQDGCNKSKSHTLIASFYYH